MITLIVGFCDPCLSTMSNENCAHAQKKLQVPKADSEGCQVRSPNVRAGFHAPRPGMPVRRAGPAGGAGRVVAGRPGPPGQRQRCEESQAPGPWAYNRRACGPRAQGTHGPATRKLPSRRVRVQAPKVKRVIAILGRRPSTQPPAIQVPPAPGSTPQIGAIIGPRCEVADHAHQSPIPGPRRDVSTPLWRLNRNEPA